MAAIRKKKKKITNHYIDNKEFLVAMTKFKASVDEAKAEGTPRPIIPNYIGTCFMEIARHLSFKPNFMNYTYREDMIADGVENCVQYIDNFDPERSSKNPFAYFTQIIYYAFLRRIQKEKKQHYIKVKAIQRSGYLEALLHEGKRTGETPELYENMQDFITTFEENLAKQKAKAAEKKKGLLAEFVVEEA